MEYNLLLPDLMEPAKLTISNDNEINLEYYVEDREGLYKRNYTNNIFDEIMSLVDFDFSFMSRYRKILVKYYNRTKERKEIFPFRQFFVNAKKAVMGIEKYSKPISAILYLHIQQIEEVTRTISIDAMEDIWYQLETTVYMQQYISTVLNELCYDELVNENRKTVPMYKGKIEFDIELNQVYENKRLNTIYKIKSIEDYYFAILQAYILSNPLIAQCKYCDRYFVPKTKKVTLYCARVTLNDKTCKLLGARQAFKDNIDGDTILKLFYSEKHRMQMYYSRCKLSQHSFLTEYYDWLDEIEPLVQKYKSGEIDGAVVKDKIFELSKND